MLALFLIPLPLDLPPTSPPPVLPPRLLALSLLSVETGPYHARLPHHAYPLSHLFRVTSSTEDKPTLLDPKICLLAPAAPKLAFAPPQTLSGRDITLYTGREIRPNGQELHHAVFLNARMLIHDPTTGRPGMRHGHAVATFATVPPDERPWPYEVAYPSVHDVSSMLPGYGLATQAEIGRQRRIGSHRLNIDRQVERAPVAAAFRINTTLPPILTPLTPTLPPVTLPSIRQVLQGPPPNLLGAPPLRVLQPKKKSFFFTHPPNVAPIVDTSAMAPAGFAADTGHRVLEFPCNMRVRDSNGRLHRTDTPAPPFRLLTEPPALRKESADSSSDVDMPPVSPDEPNTVPPVPPIPAEVLAASGGLLSSVPGEASPPSAQRWPVSNIRLEKLAYEAKQGAKSRILPASQEPPCVFGAYRSPVVAPKGSVFAAKNGEAAQKDSGPNGGDDASSGEEGSQGDCAMSIVSTASQKSSGPGPVSRESPTHDFHITRALSATASTSPASFLEGVLSPLIDDKAPISHLPDSLAPSDSASLDCRSTLNGETGYNPKPGLSTRHPSHQKDGYFDDSDSDSPPPLRSISPEEGNARDESKSLVLRTENPKVNVDTAELDGCLARIARAPPTPSVHTWTVLQNWAHTRNAYQRRLFLSENNSALGFLRQGEALLTRYPGILDTARMRVNDLIDTDLVNQFEGPEVSLDGCREFAERVRADPNFDGRPLVDRAQVQRIRDAFDAYSPGLPDLTHAIHDITHIPVSDNGKRLRQLSDRALALPLPLMYRYAVLLIVK
ncbi:hypothetical protein C8R47DRAFT_1210969 [Mycena vitilis]|nr:hypothetical protein C8R47DRAFT_1210969 [Mycena vitilis]